MKDRLTDAIRRGMAPWSTTEREDLTRDLVAWQQARIPAWDALCRRRGFSWTGAWTDVPALPTAAFKHFPLHTGGQVVAEFRTSGTSGATPGVARFTADGLAVMAESIRQSARSLLLPDDRATRILVLAPPPRAAPHMIMAAGMAQLVEEFSQPEGGFLIGPGGLDVPSLVAHCQAGVPLTLIGASFGFVHLLDGLAAKGLRLPLPAGSRIMDAGGFKGRSRVVTREDLVTALGETFAVPPDRVVNLLGMTELASQFYDNVLRDGVATPRFKVNPPWTDTLVVHPETLEPLPPGETGLLRHLDLANLDRPCVVQTDDLGRRVPGGFEVHGRATPDGSRGCSITIDELLSA